jgi:hypothetical protein
MVDEMVTDAVVRIDHVDLVGDFRRVAETVFQKNQELEAWTLPFSTADARPVR